MGGPYGPGTVTIQGIQASLGHALSSETRMCYRFHFHQLVLHSDWSVRYDHPLERVRVFAISASC